MTEDAQADRKKNLWMTGATVLSVVIVLEALGWLAFSWFVPRFENIRLVLLGDQASVVRYKKSIGQPYLLYVPAPGLSIHTKGGYRGPAVPMRRRSGYSRVLFLGGSTTYGAAIGKNRDTYPAVLSEILERQKPDGVAGVEVINGGLLFGTSAEHLTHYLFKFHYFKPDLVVIQTGGNDSVATIRDYYQPDYSHWRHPLSNPEPLPRHSRWLMRSRAVSGLIILLFRWDLVTQGYLERSDLPPPTRWYPDYDRRGDSVAPIAEEDLAFRHNLESLIRAIESDGARAVLMAFRERPRNTYSASRRVEFERYRRVMEELAGKYDLPYLPFPADIISSKNWADRRCHLRPAGCREKAAYVGPTVASQLWPEMQ